MEGKEGSKEKGKKRWLLLILLLCLCAGAWLFLASWKADDERLARERDAQEGYLPGMTRDEIQKMMDDKVAEGSVQININSELVFENGRSKGLVRIVNTKNNHYLMVVEMERKDTGERIYQSGAMEPGNYLEKDKLDVDLPKGDYPVRIRFKNYDPKSEEYIGEAVAESVVHVLH